jgi:imidazolonepropionase
MNFTVEQAIWSASMGGAKALRRGDVGAIRVGMRADLIDLNAPSALHLAYRPGVHLINQTYTSEDFK